MVKRTFFGPDSSLLNSIVTWPSPACRPEVFPHHLVRTLARPRNPHRGLPAGGLLEMALWTRYSPSKSYANSPDHLSLGQTRFNATLNLPVSHLSQPSLRNRCGAIRVLDFAGQGVIIKAPPEIVLLASDCPLQSIAKRRIVHSNRRGMKNLRAPGWVPSFALPWQEAA